MPSSFSRFLTDDELKAGRELYEQPLKYDDFLDDAAIDGAAGDQGVDPSAASAVAIAPPAPPPHARDDANG